MTGVELSGLIYPSIASNASADNLALKPKTVDECLQLVSVQYVEITQSTDGYHPFGLDYSEIISDSGEIQWSGLFPKHLLAGTDYSVDFDGGWRIIRNPKGVEVGRFKDDNEVVNLKFKWL